MMKTKKDWNPMDAFRVYLNDELIDMVFFTKGFTALDVKSSLINHDGYDSNIFVMKQRKDGTFANYCIHW
jgi:hypothetical protein